LEGGKNTFESVMEELARYRNVFEIKSSTFVHKTLETTLIMGRRASLPK